ncbi:hypothetical protein CRD_00032 [Raphidiopsis brookii D9]|nr:hypothetical protein CRD_00032 [Raphidiopsis brookii D9]
MTKITNQALNSALNQLWVFSLSSDFWEYLYAAFGTEYNRKNAEILRSQWQIGDFSQLPEIEILDSSILGSANGAYSSSENRIYLSSNLMENGTSSKIREVLIEEIGHFVDSRINQIDTPGDEGEYFAGLVTDKKLNKDEIDRLKAEDDRVVVTIDGKGVEVEQNTNPPDWTRLLGNVGSNEVATGLAMGTDDSVYVVGSTLTTEGFIAKYKPDGTQVWKKPYAKDYSTVTTGSDGSIYVANEGGFITKNKPEDGTQVWKKNLGTSSYDILSRAITTGSDGSIYVVGGTRESGSSNAVIPKYDAVIAKYSSDGNLVWRRSLGTTGGDDFAYAVVLGSDGSIYAAGSTQGNLNSENYNGDSSGLSGDAFITKYTSDGTRVWTRLLGTSSSDIATSLAVDSFGYVYVSGATDGNLDGQTNNGLFDAFLSKYDPGGTKIWTKLLGDDKDNFGLASTSSNNSIYVGGFTGTYSRNFSSPSSDDLIRIQSSDRFISKYNVDGTQSWINTLVTPSNDFVRTLNTGKDGSIYVGGGTDGNLDGQNKSGSGYDAFISKFTDDNRFNPNVVTPKVNISTGLIFTAQSNGNVILDTNRGSATPDEVTSVQNGTKSNFNHIIGLYEVLNSQGEIKDDQGKTLKPEDANYALHALTTARVKNFAVRAGGNDTPSTATQLGSGVSVLAGKLYAPFAIANGGTYFPGNQGIEDFVAAEQGDINRFSAAPQYVRNLVDIEGKNGDIFNNAPRFVQEPVAYFSFGAANPDGSHHFRSYGNGVYGFEDLPVSYTQYSNNDFNDGVFALTLSI